MGKHKSLVICVWGNALLWETQNTIPPWSIAHPERHAYELVQPTMRSEGRLLPCGWIHGRVRVCGDFKITINQACQADSYPMPRVEELFTALSGGKYFSKLDLSQAYLQLELDDESKPYTTINTHKELFQFNRLPMLPQAFSKGRWRPY